MPWSYTRSNIITMVFVREILSKSHSTTAAKGKTLMGSATKHSDHTSSVTFSPRRTLFPIVKREATSKFKVRMSNLVASIVPGKYFAQEAVEPGMNFGTLLL